MKTKIIILNCFLGMMFLSGCNRLLNTEISVHSNDEYELNTDGFAADYALTNHDYKTTYDRAIEIDLENADDIETESYSVIDGTLTIVAEGNYVLKGSVPNGNIIVNVCDDEVVHLFFDDVQIVSGDSPALYIYNADKVIITLQEGTSNSLCDNARRKKDVNACVFSNADLTINGQGTLNVFGYHEDGIRTKDQLKLVNTFVYVKAKGDGLRGNDGVILNDSTVEVECEKNGIFSDSLKDIIALQGGSCKVVAGEYAIRANTRVVIQGVEADLYSVFDMIKCDGSQEIEEGCINGE